MAEDDERQHEDEDELAAGWILEPAPWSEIGPCERSASPALLTASWRGSPVVVVAQDVIEEWSTTRWAGVFPTTSFNAQCVDVPATLAAEGLTGENPPNALVVRNCEGIQIGNWNVQSNIHKFRVEGVRITLDQALARTLAASVPAPAAQPVEAYTKVAIWTSRGVQIGNFNTQRNVFRHVVTGPEVALGQNVQSVVDKLRNGQIGAAERELRIVTRRLFERDAEQLYAALDVAYNENLPMPPGVLSDTISSTYGLGNDQTVRESVDVRSVDLVDLMDVLNTPVESEEPVDLEFPEPEPLPPPDPPDPWDREPPKIDGPVSRWPF